MRCPPGANGSVASDDEAPYGEVFDSEDVAADAADDPALADLTPENLDGAILFVEETGDVALGDSLSLLDALDSAL